MMTRFKQLSVTALALAVYVIPGVVFAQAIKNPIGANSVAALLVNFTNFLLSLVVVLALLGSVWAGVRMILSVGNEKGVADAKKILLWSIAGLVVASLSYVIIQVVAKNILGIAGA